MSLLKELLDKVAGCSDIFKKILEELLMTDTGDVTAGTPAHRERWDVIALDEAAEWSASAGSDTSEDLT